MSPKAHFITEMSKIYILVCLEEINHYLINHCQKETSMHVVIYLIWRKRHQFFRNRNPKKELLKLMLVITQYVIPAFRPLRWNKFFGNHHIIIRQGKHLWFSKLFRKLPLAPLALLTT